MAKTLYASWVLSAPQREAFVSPIPENILGLDTLQGQTLQAPIGGFSLQVRVIKSALRGSANWDQLVSLPPGRVVAVRQDARKKEDGPGAPPRGHAAPCTQRLQQSSVAIKEQTAPGVGHSCLHKTE